MCVHEGERARETLPVLPYSKGLVMVPCRCNARGFTDPVGPLQGPDMRLPKIGTLRRGEASARSLRCVDKESLLSLKPAWSLFWRCFLRPTMGETCTRGALSRVCQHTDPFFHRQNQALDLF